MAEEVKISFTIDGIQQQVKSVEELQDAVAGLGKSAKKTADDTKKLASEQGFIADKVAGLKKTFSGLKGDFKNAKSGISAFFKSGTTGAKALKIGLASLGIPLLIAAVVSLISYFNNFEIVTRTIQKAMNALGAIVANVGKAFSLLISGDFSGAFNVMKDAVVEAVEATDDLFDSAKRLNEIQIRNATQNAKLRQEMEGYKKILEDTTASEKDRLDALDEVTERTKLLAAAQLEENQAAIDGLEAQIKLENNEVARRDLELELAELRADRIDQQTELNNIEFDAAKVGREIVQQRLDQEESAAAKSKEIKDKAAADDKARKDKAAADEVLRKESLDGKLLDLEDQNKILQAESAAEKAQAELDIQLKKETDDLDRLLATEEQKKALKTKYAILQQKLDDDVQANKDKIAKEQENREKTANKNSIDGIVDLAGEGSAIAKSVALTQTGIATYKGAQSAFADTPGGVVIKSIAAGIAVATGLKSMAKIAGIKTIGSKSAGTAPSITAPTVPDAPAFDPTASLDAASSGQVQNNQLELNEQNQVVRAYVVSSEVTDQQEADSRINELARL